MQEPAFMFSLNMLERLNNATYPCYACKSRVEIMYERQLEDGSWRTGDGMTTARCCSDGCRQRFDTAVRHAHHWAAYGYVSFSAAFSTSLIYSYWFRRLYLWWDWCWFGTIRVQPCRMQRLFPTAVVPMNQVLANDLAALGLFTSGQVAAIVQFTTMG
jgi:hypothetical protein